MSSIATAPSRTAEKDGYDNQQPHALANADETLTQDFSRAESLASNAQPSDEANRVERLLNQLEARSMALVPYGYGTLREIPVQKPNTALIAGVLVILWLSSVALAIAYIRYANPAPISDRAAAPLVIPGEADPQEQKVARSVDHLAKALISSSERMNELQAAMERSNLDLQRIASKVSEGPKAASAAPINDAAVTTPAAGLAAEALPKNWHKVLDIKPTEAAVPHKGGDGLIDYWLVQRGADTAPVKILPIGTSPEGVVIHSLDDGKDYTLTPAGEWRTGALTPPAN
jgi:hypothetical protein